MSRLHRQKLRLRAMQRGEGIINEDEKEIDRDAIESEGTVHVHHLESLDPDNGDDDEGGDDEGEEKKPAAKRKKTKRKAARKHRS